MSRRIKKAFRTNEPYIFLIIIALGIVIQIRSGQFFTGNNMVDLLSAMIVPGLFAIAEFLALISGALMCRFRHWLHFRHMPPQKCFWIWDMKEMCCWLL